MARCPLCAQSHPLYHCEDFKSKAVKERGELVRTKWICFNCLYSIEHSSSKACKSLVRCKAPGCGKPHHTLLHLPSPLRISALDQANNIKAGVPSTLPMEQPDNVDPPSSMCASLNESSEILVQIILLNILGNNGKSMTTYGLINSGSYVTMIDPSPIDQLEIPGEMGQLLLSTVSQRDQREEGINVSFKIVSVCHQGRSEVTVRDAWAIRDLTIPLKHVAVQRKKEHWPHLRQVLFPELQRKKVSVLIGTGVQEAFIPLEVRKGNPNEPFAIRSCLGWSIVGSCSGERTKRQFNINKEEEVTLSRQLENFWRVESCGTDH